MECVSILSVFPFSSLRIFLYCLQGCHARISAPKAQLGLPELSLGIMPGFGGELDLPFELHPPTKVGFYNNSGHFIQGHSVFPGLLV